MRGYPVASGDVNFDDYPVNVSETGADLTYIMSRVLGYTSLVASSVLVAAQLF